MSSDKMQVDLEDPTEGTTTWARITDEGMLEIESYDYSDRAQEQLGSDHTLVLRIDPGYKEIIFDQLSEPGEQHNDQGLLERLGERFEHFFELKKWLVENEIPFEKSSQFFV